MASGLGVISKARRDSWIGDVIMIAAIFLVPIFALWAQWQLQLRHERRQQRVRIYATLMSTRHTALDIEHVKALNYDRRCIP